MRAKRFSPQDAHSLLSFAKRKGDIFFFEQRSTDKGVRFVIETVPTYRDHYLDPEAHGMIALSTREVMAFMEGLYAGTRVRDAQERPPVYIEGERFHPVHRAGDSIR